MSRIHATAVVSSRAEIDSDVVVGAFSVIGDGVKLGRAVVLGHGVLIDGDVKIGDESELGHYVVVKGPVTIGGRNRIYPQCVFGEDGQHPGTRLLPQRRIVIGADNTWREQVTVHQPTTTPTTQIGDRGYFMVQAHISHDAVVGDDVKFAMGVTLAGHVTVGASAYLGMHTVVHQRIVVGGYAMVGMNSSVVKHVPPGAVIVGQRFAKLNEIGLRKAGHGDAAISAMVRIHEAAASGESIEPAVFDVLGRLASQFYRDVAGHGFYSLTVS